MIPISLICNHNECWSILYNSRYIVIHTGYQPFSNHRQDGVIVTHVTKQHIKMSDFGKGTSEKRSARQQKSSYYVSKSAYVRRGFCQNIYVVAYSSCIRYTFSSSAFSSKQVNKNFAKTVDTLRETLWCHFTPIHVYSILYSTPCSISEQKCAQLCCHLWCCAEFQGALLLTWIKFNPMLDDWSHTH